MELAKEEAEIEKVEGMVRPSVVGVNPKTLQGPDYQWYRDAVSQLEPHYRRARYLQDVIMTHELDSLTKSSAGLEASSGRLEEITKRQLETSSRLEDSERTLIRATGLLFLATIFLILIANVSLTLQFPSNPLAFVVVLAIDGLAIVILLLGYRTFGKLLFGGE